MSRGQAAVVRKKTSRGAAPPVRKEKQGALGRARNRQGVRSEKGPPVVVHTGIPVHPSVCDRCGAVYTRKKWSRRRILSDRELARAAWTRCPACRQVASGAYMGRLLLRGPGLARQEAEIRRRILNVEARSLHTQPERRVVSIERDRDGLEVLTTSQKLAHRIAREIEKAFRGVVEYCWSDDGVLFATWHAGDGG
jgi:NMD protein affecting ribosome stability and mRNA decay